MNEDLKSISSPRFSVTKVGSSTMFNLKNLSKNSSLHIENGIVGTQIDIKFRVGEHANTLIQEMTENQKNLNASILSTSSGQSLLKNDQVLNSSSRRRVMKINVTSPALGSTEKIVESANRTQNLEFFSETTEGLIKLPSSSGIPQEMDNIREKLCKSPLNSQFQNDVKQIVSYEKLLNKHEGQMQVIFQDWTPVVCRPTQQFLHNNDERQKSEYKQFAGKTLRNRKHIISHTYKRREPKPQKSRSPSDSIHEATELCLTYGSGQKITQTKMPKQRLVFKGSVLKQSPRSPPESSMFASKVDFQDGNLKLPDASTSTFPVQTMFKSDSNDTALAYDKSAFMSLLLLSSDVIPKNVQNRNRDRGRPKFKTGRFNRKSFSLVNIDSAVLIVQPNLSPSPSREEKQVIKVPTQPKIQNAPLDSMAVTDAFPSPKKESTEIVYSPRQLHENSAPSQERLMKNTDDTGKWRENQIQTPPRLNQIVKKDSQSPRANNLEIALAISQKKQTSKRRNNVSNLEANLGLAENKTNNEDLLHLVKNVVQLQNQEAQRATQRDAQRTMNYSSIINSKTRRPKLNVELLHSNQSNIVLNNISSISSGESGVVPQKSIQLNTLRLEIESQPTVDNEQLASRNLEKMISRITEEKHEQMASSKNHTPEQTERQSNKAIASGTSSLIDQVHSQVSLGGRKLNTQSREDGRRLNMTKGPHKRDSVVLKSVQVTNDGRKIYLADPDFTSGKTRFKPLVKQDIITEAKKKALNDRLQKCIEFNSEKMQPMMISQPAPISSKIAISIPAEDRPTEVLPSIPPAVDSKNQEKPNNFTNEKDPSPFPTFRELAQFPCLNLNSPLFQGSTTSNSMTFTISERDGVATETQNSAIKQAEQKSVGVINHKPVKVRLFDIGSGTNLQNTIEAKDKYNSAAKNRQKGNGTLQYEENKQRLQTKLLNQHPIERDKTKQNQKSSSPPPASGYPSSGQGDGQPMHSQQIVELLTKVHSDSDERKPVGFTVSNRHIETKILAQNFRDLNSSSGTSRKMMKPPSIKADQSPQMMSVTGFTKFNRTSASPRPSFSNNVAEPPSPGITNSNKKTENKKIKSINFKIMRSSQDPILEFSNSNETKYFNISQQKSNAGDLKINCNSTYEDEDIELDYLKQHFCENIKVVSLSSVATQKKLISPPKNSGEMMSVQISKNEKYQQLTSMIETMFKKKDKRNPVQSKSTGQQMIRHVHWNKVLREGFKTPTNHLSQTRYVTPSKGNVRVNSQQHTERWQPQEFKNFLNIANVAKGLKGEEVFLKSETARLHPFYHSLVNQNYEIINKQMRGEDQLVQDFIAASPNIPLKSQLSQDSLSSSQSPRVNHAKSSLLRNDTIFQRNSVQNRDELIQRQNMERKTPTQRQNIFRQSANLQRSPTFKEQQIDTKNQTFHCYSNHIPQPFHQQLDVMRETRETLYTSPPSLLGKVSTTTKNTNISPKEEDLIAILQIPTTQISNINIGNEKTAKGVSSPLMEKSRQIPLSNVYRQLHRSRDFKKSSVLNKNTQYLISTSNSKGQSLAGSFGKIFNKDLVEDGAASNKYKFEACTEMPVGHRSRKIQLPPVKVNTQTDFEDIIPIDIESPLDSIFPALIQRQTSENSKSNMRNNVKKRLTHI